MSEQPLFDVEALRKIDAKPGDTFVLELSEDHFLLDPEDLARANAQINAVLGFEVKVLFVSPDMALRKIEAKPGDVFHLELSGKCPSLTTDESLRLAADAESCLGDGVSVLVTQPGAKLEKQTTARATVSALKQADLRILLDGEPVPIGSPAYCTPWLAEGIDCTNFTQKQHIEVMQSRRGQFIARSGCDLLGRRIRVEHLGDGEAFDALVTLMTGPGRYLFVSDGAPSPLPVPSLKEANEQHAAEPIEPQADEPHKVQWREFL